MNDLREVQSERVFDLLAELSVDPFKCSALLRDPAAILVNAGLSPAEQIVMERRARGERAASPAVLGAFFFDPGDDPNPNPDPPTEPE